MKALIVGRTHMGSAACVGALELESGRSLRLFEPGHEYPAQTTYAVGEIWELNIGRDERSEPPHVEDVVVRARQRLGTEPSPRTRVLSLVTPWTGPIYRTFQQCLVLSGGRLFVEDGNQIPSGSTGFWIADRAFRFDEDSYVDARGHAAVKYVGLSKPPSEIVAGDLVRLSLASWWAPLDGRRRCYLQISGIIPEHQPAEGAS